MKLDLSPTSRGRVVFGTVGGTLFCVFVALFIDSFNFHALTPDQVWRALLTDIAIPLVLAGPLLYLFLHKLRQLALTQQELTILASTDSLTEIYNRGAFKMLVEAYLKEANAERKEGAFLLIDADYFKQINDRFGHDKGDDALRTIAMTIKHELRGADLVGRLGGEEFGVFLPGADARQAETIAERIRSAVAAAQISALGMLPVLSVSIGGVTFAGRLTFDELFTAADRHLYKAKGAGRNQVHLSLLDRTG